MRNPFSRTSRRGLRPLVVLASAVVGLIVAGLLTGMAFAGIGGGPGGPGGPGDGAPGHHRHGPVDGPGAGWRGDGPGDGGPGPDRATSPDTQPDGAGRPDGAAPADPGSGQAGQGVPSA